MQNRQLITAGLIVLAAATSQARTVDEWPEIRREINVTEDVIAASLRETFDRDMTVHTVEGTYLPRQGVLFNVHLSAPWFSIDTKENGADLHIDANLNLEEIPRMVHDILAELQIAVAPYAPEALAELKDLREEQRELRREQRGMRSELRKHLASPSMPEPKPRRQLPDATPSVAPPRQQHPERDEQQREDIQAQIADLEVELEAAEAAGEALSADIETQYERLQEEAQPVKRQKSDAPDASIAVTTAICDAAATLKSLRNDNYVTVALRQGGSMTYITYSMETAKDCQRRNIDAAKLLDKAWTYQGS